MSRKFVFSSDISAVNFIVGCDSLLEPVFIQIYPNTGSRRESHLATIGARQFARRRRLRYIFHNKKNKQHPFHVKSNWEHPAQQSVALETYLEEIKVQLAGIELIKPRNNFPFKERKALREQQRSS